MKPIQTMITSNLKAQINPDFAILLSLLMTQTFKEEKYDMFVLEPSEKQKDKMNIRISGYHIETQELEEERIIKTINAPQNTPTIWCKIDDYGDRFVIILLLPSDW